MTTILAMPATRPVKVTQLRVITSEWTKLRTVRSTYWSTLIAVVLGTLILKESFSWRMAVAAAIVLAGMALVRDSSA